MTADKKTANKPTGYRIYSQYVLIGAALGLYYGLFYKNSQDKPDYLMVVILSLLAALLTTTIRSWKKKKTFNSIAWDFAKIWAMFLAFLLTLELNSVIEGIGGRPAVVVFMTSIGVLFGLIMGMRRRTT